MLIFGAWIKNTILPISRCCNGRGPVGLTFVIRPKLLAYAMMLCRLLLFKVYYFMKETALLLTNDCRQDPLHDL